MSGQNRIRNGTRIACHESDVIIDFTGGVKDQRTYCVVVGTYFVLSRKTIWSVFNRYALKQIRFMFICGHRIEKMLLETFRTP